MTSLYQKKLFKTERVTTNDEVKKSTEKITTSEGVGKGKDKFHKRNEKIITNVEVDKVTKILEDMK